MERRSQDDHRPSMRVRRAGRRLVQVAEEDDAGGLEDCAPWRNFDGGNPPAVEHHQPIAMAGAKHPGVLGEGLEDSLDDLVLILVVVLVPDVELVTAHQANPEH